jgi:two-component system cell cycle sensor histidine kinase/response regulator CckA
MFEAAFYASVVPMTISRLADGRLVAINDACCRMLGFERSEIIGKTAEEVGHLLNPDQVEGLIHTLEHGTVISGLEVPFRRRNGELGFASVSASAIDIDGEPGVLSVVLDVTGTHSAEAALRSSEARFAAVFNAAGVMIVVSNLRTGQVVDVNRAFLEQSGYTREEVIGRDAYEIGVFADPADGARIDAALREQGQVRDLEISVANPDGRLGHALLSADIVEIEGEPHLITAAVDTTSRREAAEALRASEERYRNVVEQTADGVLLLDDEGRILDANAALAAYAGRSVEEMRGNLWTDYIEPQNLEEIPFQRPEFEAGNVSVFERRIRRPDGSVAEIEVHARRLEDGRMLGTAREVGARKAAERERARLIQAIEQSADSVAITDLAGTIVYANPTLARAMGAPRERLIGQQYRFLRDEALAEGLYDDVLGAIHRDGRWNGELPRRGIDGSVAREAVTVSAVRDGSGAIVNFVVVRRDITRERDLEERLQQAEKLEAVGRLAGGVAHDFNNLLTAISGFAELAMADATPGSEMAEYLSEIQRSTERATTLTRQLLAFGRRARLEPMVLDLNRVVADVAPMLRRIIGEDVRLDLETDPGVRCVQADRGQLEQVIVNLAANARDAMPGGGRLTISTQNVEVDSAYAASHTGGQTGDFVRLSIADTGVGMDSETVEHIFEPFFTTKGPGGNVGLGLATVFGIVRQSGGHIRVDSQPGRGSTFVIDLPAVEGPNEAAVEIVAAPAPEAVPAGAETILVVEDEPAVLSFAARLLDRHGYTVLHASNGEEAIDRARTHDGRIDLLFSDLVMPGLTGQQTAAAIRAMRPDIGLLFASGYSDDMNAGDRTPAGIRFLAKPYTAEGLLRAVRDALAGP